MFFSYITLRNKELSAWLLVDKLNFTILSSLLISALVLFYYYIFFNPYVLYSNYSDASYYISIANSIYTGMGLHDATSIPHSSLTTSQNGIAFVGYLLLLLGAYNLSKLFVALAIVNFISFIVSLILLCKIAGCLKLNEKLTLLIIVNFFLLSNVFPVLIAPLNDGISLTLSLLGLWIGIKNYGHDKSWFYILAFVTSMVAIHFRLQTLLIPISCAFASLFTRQYKSFFIYLCIVLASYLSIYFIYRHLVDNGIGVFKTVEYVVTNIRFDLLGKIIVDTGRGFSSLFLQFGEGGGHGVIDYAFPVFTVVTLLITIYCSKILLKREYKTTLISLIILSTIILFTFTPWKATRYILIILPLLMILFATSYNGLYLKALYSVYVIYSVTILTIRLCCIYPLYLEQQRNVEKLLPLVNNGTVLFSEDNRFSYLVFNKPSHKEYNLSTGESDVILYGSHEFLINGIAQINSRFQHSVIINYTTHMMAVGAPNELVRVTLTR